MKEELNQNFKKFENINTNKAKNVIIFIGDGMSLPTLSTARIYKTQMAHESGQLLNKTGEDTLLTMESLDHMGLSRVSSHHLYNNNKSHTQRSFDIIDL